MDIAPYKDPHIQKIDKLDVCKYGLINNNISDYQDYQTIMLK